MNAEHTILEKHLKRTTIISNVFSMLIALITACLVVYAFYYNTTDTLAEHTEDIKEVKSEVNEINMKMQDFEVYQGVSKSEFKALQEKVLGIEKTVEKMDDKLDRLLLQTR